MCILRQTLYSLTHTLNTFTHIHMPTPHIHTQTHIHSHTHSCTSTHTPPHSPTHTHTYTPHSGTYTHSHIHSHTPHTRIHSQARTHTSTHLHSHTNTLTLHSHSQIQTHSQPQTHTHSHTLPHTQTPTYTTHTHTHTHTHTWHLHTHTHTVTHTHTHSHTYTLTHDTHVLVPGPLSGACSPEGVCGIPMPVTWLHPQVASPRTSVQGRRVGHRRMSCEALFILFWTHSFPVDFPRSILDYNCISGPFFVPRKGRKVGTLAVGPGVTPIAETAPSSGTQHSENLRPLSEKAELDTGGVGRLLGSSHAQITGCPSTLKNAPGETLKGLCPVTSDPRVQNELRVVVGRWRRADNTGDLESDRVGMTWLSHIPTFI